VDIKTGFVTSVRMEKSTGHKILDDAALEAFRQWRIKPGTIRKFRTPITYNMLN
jgi:TonB family protein